MGQHSSHPSQPIRLLHSSGQEVRKQLRVKPNTATTTTTSTKELKITVPTQPAWTLNPTPKQAPQTSMPSLPWTPRLCSTAVRRPRASTNPELMPGTARTIPGPGWSTWLRASMEMAVTPCSHRVRLKATVSMCATVITTSLRGIRASRASTLREEIMRSTCQRSIFTFSWKGELLIWVIWPTQLFSITASPAHAVNLHWFSTCTSTSNHREAAEMNAKPKQSLIFSIYFICSQPKPVFLHKKSELFFQIIIKCSHAYKTLFICACACNLLHICFCIMVHALPKFEFHMSHAFQCLSLSFTARVCVCMCVCTTDLSVIHRSCDWFIEWWSHFLLMKWNVKK